MDHGFKLDVSGKPAWQPPIGSLRAPACGHHLQASAVQRHGYEGYSAVPKREDIIHVGCLAHARRKFDEAVKGQTTNKTRLARQGFDIIQRIYRIEREASARDRDERNNCAMKKQNHYGEEMRQRLDGSIIQAPPGTLTGKALRYLDKQWPRLIRDLDDGRLEAIIIAPKIPGCSLTRPPNLLNRASSATVSTRLILCRVVDS